MATLKHDKILFKKFTSKLSDLFASSSEGDRSLLNKTLDDLNSLNFRQPLIEDPTDAIHLIAKCCKYISPDDKISVPKCCRFITKFINLQNVTLETTTFLNLMIWSTKILSNPKKEYVSTLEVLILLDMLVRSTNLVFETTFILNILDPKYPAFQEYKEMVSPEILRYTLQFLEACTIIDKTVPKETLTKLKVLMPRCIDIFKYHLLRIGNQNDATELKIKIICLRGLENIICTFDDNMDVGAILGIVRYYMLLGVRDTDFLVPTSLMPSTHSIPEPSSNTVREKKGGKVTKLRKHKVNKQKQIPPSEDWMTTTSSTSDLDNKKPPLKQMVTSDSDVSDSGIQKGNNIPRLQARVRQMSLSLLFLMAEKLKKVMLTYWTSFIPDDLRASKQFLTTCILEDPSADCREAALNILLYMLTSYKLCLSQADSCDRTAFTPFSAILGYMIVCLHDTLNLALKEKITPVLAQVLKCYAALVEATPYKRLKPNLITEAVYNVNPLLEHKDPTIKTGALMVFGCILASEPIVEETKRVFLRSDLNDNAENPNKEHTEKLNMENLQIREKDKMIKLPSILQKCLDNLQRPNGENIIDHTPLPVKIESLNVISSMCRNYFDCLIYPHLSIIEKSICDCLLDKNIDLKLHTGRTIDCIGQSMAEFLEQSERRNDGFEEPGVSFWLSLLDEMLLTSFRDDPSLIAVACDCIGSIGVRIFENLPINKHFLCITYLLSCSREDEHRIKGAALRSLGILVRYPELKEDPGFIIDVAEAVYRTIDDENVDLKMKSSWALGNLTDILILNNMNEKQEKFHDILIMKLLRKCITSMTYNQRVKANISRGIGNLLFLVSQETFKKLEYRNIAESAVDCLINGASTAYTMKLKWNSCYGLSLVLKNEAIYIDCHEMLTTIFSTLNQLLIESPNFKVRTSAASALASPSKRVYYGVHYQDTWLSLLKTLENLEQIEDHLEYQHKDRTIEQVCLTLAHLLSLCEMEDISLMRKSLNMYYEICTSQMKRIYECLVPEKSNIIFTAAEHLKTFNKFSLNAENLEALSMLQDLVVQDL